MCVWWTSLLLFKQNRIYLHLRIHHVNIFGKLFKSFEKVFLNIFREFHKNISFYTINAEPELHCDRESHQRKPAQIAKCVFFILILRSVLSAGKFGTFTIICELLRKWINVWIFLFVRKVFEKLFPSLIWTDFNFHLLRIPNLENSWNFLMNLIFILVILPNC